ncbi:MAG: SAM-dependent methyltransferase [Planctomycetaceae bacterium]|jgi:23S rRNA (cytidine2498-2'-O)-methyltransferase|nr:SAM-dependent methyltransferase [Planctomycetaceae bacterium]
MFLFTLCQVGAETTFKTEIRQLFPEFRLSFSRPGFLTFKVPDDLTLDNTADFVNRSVFARTAAISLGKINPKTTNTQNRNTKKTVDENIIDKSIVDKSIVDKSIVDKNIVAEKTAAEKNNIEKTETFTDLANKIWAITETNRIFVNRVHVFRRDPLPPGEKGFEPGLTPELQMLHRILIKHSPKPKFLGIHHTNPNYPAQPNETVLNVVETDSDYYFVGIHSISEGLPIQSYYPGGVLPISIPDNAVSRAWLKFEEGLRWSGFPITKGDYCLDIGAAPGGSSQVLLSRGAKVLGVDPAEIEPTILNHPHFTHIRSRISQTKRSIYRHIRWIIADINVAPNYTLDVLEEPATRNDIPLCGMLFTLKLFHWSFVEHLPTYINRLRDWGFDDIRVKQLVFNRRELMVAAQYRR